MLSEMIDVETADGVADAYLARPDDGQRPAVLLVMDAYGLRPQIERMADRIAARGFVLLAPNVFYRAGRAPVFPLASIGDPGQQGRLLQQAMPLIGELTPERIARDGGAYLDRLEHAGGGPVAITGYCMGGRVAWRIGAAGDRPKDPDVLRTIRRTDDRRRADRVPGSRAMTPATEEPTCDTAS